VICKEITLDSRALDYIRENLTSGYTLAKRVARSVDLTSGKVVTLLPENAKTDSLYDFQLSGKLPQRDSEATSFISDEMQWAMVPIPTADECLVEYISQFFRSGIERMCVIQNALASPSDGWISRSKDRFLFFEHEVYGPITSDEADRKANIQQAIKNHASIGPPTLAVLTKVPNVSKFHNQKLNITSEDLNAFAAETEAIIVGAYDGESYVIWQGR
jgi:hypothetical protein